MVGPGRAAGGVPRRPGLPLRQLREEGVRHAGEAARQGQRARRPPGQRGVVRVRQGLLPGPVERAEATRPVPGGEPGPIRRRRGCKAWSGGTAGRRRETSGSSSPCSSTTARTARPFGCWSIAWTRSGGTPHRTRRSSSPSRPKRHATETGKEVHGQFERILRVRREDGRRRCVRVRPGDRQAEGEPKKRGAREGHQTFRRIVPEGQPDGPRGAQGNVPKGRCGSRAEAERPAEKTVIDLVFTRSGCRKTVTRYDGTRAAARSASEHYNPGLVRMRNPQPSGTASRRGPSTRGSSSGCPTRSSPR